MAKRAKTKNEKDKKPSREASVVHEPAAPYGLKPTTAKRGARKQAPSKSRGNKKAATKPEPPRKLFDAKKWCGILPELAGDSLKIQRKMRDEW